MDANVPKRASLGWLGVASKSFESVIAENNELDGHAFRGLDDPPSYRGDADDSDVG